MPESETKAKTLSVMRYIPFLLVLGLFGCSTPRATLPAGARTVLLKDLISDPKAFDGKKVSVVGFFHGDYESGALYLYTRDVRETLTARSIFIGTKEYEPWTMPKLDVTDVFVVVEGTFFSEHPGYAGKLTKVTRFVESK